MAIGIIAAGLSIIVGVFLLDGISYPFPLVCSLFNLII